MEWRGGALSAMAGFYGSFSYLFKYNTLPSFYISSSSISLLTSNGGVCEGKLTGGC